MPVIVQQQRQGIRYVYEDGPFDFDKGIDYLRENKTSLGNPWDLFKVRILLDSTDEINTDGTNVAITLIYAPKKRDVIVVDKRHDPILRNPRKATDAHRSGREFYVNDSRFRKLAETDPEKAIESGVLLLSRREIERLEGDGISTSRFGKDKYSYFLARKQSRQYGLLLKEKEIDNIIVSFVGQDYVNFEERSFARKLWIRGLSDKSSLFGDPILLEEFGRVFGVQFSPTEQVVPERLYRSMDLDLERRVK